MTDEVQEREMAVAEAMADHARERQGQRESEAAREFDRRVQRIAGAGIVLSTSHTERARYLAEVIHGVNPITDHDRFEAIFDAYIICLAYEQAAGTSGPKRSRPYSEGRFYPGV